VKGVTIILSFSSLKESRQPVYDEFAAKELVN
jgi:hypothetical protein